MGLSKWKLRVLQGDRIKMIREDLQLKKPIKTISSSHFHGKMYTQVTQQELLEFLLKRSFYPVNDDIHNHIGKAKRALELSRYDQR